MGRVPWTGPCVCRSNKCVWFRFSKDQRGRARALAPIADCAGCAHPSKRKRGHVVSSLNRAAEGLAMAGTGFTVTTTAIRAINAPPRSWIQTRWFRAECALNRKVLSLGLGQPLVAFPKPIRTTTGIGTITTTVTVTDCVLPSLPLYLYLCSPPWFTPLPAETGKFQIISHSFRTAH